MLGFQSSSYMIYLGAFGTVDLTLCLEICSLLSSHILFAFLLLYWTFLLYFLFFTQTDHGLSTYASFLLYLPCSFNILLSSHSFKCHLYASISKNYITNPGISHKPHTSKFNMSKTILLTLHSKLLPSVDSLGLSFSVPVVQVTSLPWISFS